MRKASLVGSQSVSVRMKSATKSTMTALFPHLEDHLPLLRTEPTNTSQTQARRCCQPAAHHKGVYKRGPPYLSVLRTPVKNYNENGDTHVTVKGQVTGEARKRVGTTADLRDFISGGDWRRMWRRPTSPLVHVNVTHRRRQEFGQLHETTPKEVRRYERKLHLQHSLHSSRSLHRTHYRVLFVQRLLFSLQYADTFGVFPFTPIPLCWR